MLTVQQHYFLVGKTKYMLNIKLLLLTWSGKVSKTVLQVRNMHFLHAYLTLTHNQREVVDFGALVSCLPIIN